MNKLIFYVLFIVFFTCHALVPISSSRTIEVGFSPDGHAIDLILNGINSAKGYIKIAAYSFTNQNIAEALLRAHNRGIKIYMVVDHKSNYKKTSLVHHLANNGIAVRLNKHYAIFHDKFMIIDGINVETGSFNYTKAAAMRNAENVIYLSNAEDIANIYMAEWQKLWKESLQL